MKLCEKDEIHGKIEQYWRSNEINLMTEVQQSQQKLWQSREQLRPKPETSKTIVPSKTLDKGKY